MQNNLLNIKNILSAEAHKLSEKFNIKTIEVFGSYTRGEQTEKSDIDLLVTFTSIPSLLKFIAFKG